MDFFPIPYDFAENYIRFSKPEYIQVYLYLLYRHHKDGKIPAAEQLAAELDISPEHTIFILEFWANRGELLHTEDGYVLPQDSAATPSAKRRMEKPASGTRRATRPSYTMAEIDAVAAKNKSLSGLFYQAETVLQKVLTQSDMEMLYSFVDWLGLPVEVITMLLSYGAKRGKTGRRYLETVAIDWAERGIDTFEAAEAHISELEARDSAERKIRGILGIYDRALTATEKKYIKQWTEEDAVPAALIPLAYDRTVAHTGKLSWSYMNKILQSWQEAGYTTEEQVQTAEAALHTHQAGNTKPSALPKKSRFNNYEDTNPVDYHKLEEQLLDMMLDHGE